MKKKISIGRLAASYKGGEKTMPITVHSNPNHSTVVNVNEDQAITLMKKLARRFNYKLTRQLFSA